LSQLNGSLEEFKAEYADRIIMWFGEFDDLILDRSSLTFPSVQERLFQACTSSGQEMALMIYLVEECGLRLGAVCNFIKAKHVRLGYDLARSQRVVLA
jgi:hypothetical protein